MVLRETGNQMEATETPIVPWVFAVAFIPFGLFLLLWGSGLVASGHSVERAARATMIVLGLFAIGLPVLMLRSIPRVHLVINRDRGVMTLEQSALGRHARAEWPLSSIAALQIAKGINLNDERPWRTRYRMQFVLTSGQILVPSPSWKRQHTIESVANALASALGIPVTTTDKYEPVGFPDKTLLNSDMGRSGVVERMP